MRLPAFFVSAYLDRLISGACVFLSALVVLFSSSASAQSPSPGILPAQAKSWHAIYTIDKPRTAADKTWNASKKKLNVEGTLTEKLISLKVDMGFEHRLTLNAVGDLDGTWVDIEKGESGIFRAAYEKERAAYVITMGKGNRSHNSYGDYTITLQRAR